VTVASWYWIDGGYEEPWPGPQSKQLCVDYSSIEERLKPRNLVFRDGVAEAATGPKGAMSQEEVALNSKFG
jgi:hypothetical protein